MNIDFRNNPRVKYIDTTQVANMLSNKDYSTVTVFKKIYENGCEIINGYFTSKRELNEDELKANINYNNNDPQQIYYSNNQYSDDISSSEINSIQNNNNLPELQKYFNPLINFNKSENESKSESKSKNISNPTNPIRKTLLNFIYMTILIFLILILIDLGYYFFQVSKENEIERRICNTEYLDHSCDKVSYNDGPILNEFCKEKEKCKDVKYNKVYFNTILSKFVKDVFWNFFSSFLEFSVKSLSTIFLIVVGLIIIRKFIL